MDELIHPVPEEHRTRPNTPSARVKTLFHFRADVAQLVERLPEEQSVGGSSPSVSTIILAGHTATHPSMNEYCRSRPIGTPVKRHGF